MFRCMAYRFIQPLCSNILFCYIYIYMLYICIYDFFIIDTYDIFHVIYRVDKSLSLSIYIYTYIHYLLHISIYLIANV